MRERTFIHVAGPAGVGKTTFIERLLETGVGRATCIRATRASGVPRANDELGRYRSAGAGPVAHYRFAEPDIDAFFGSDVIRNYSEVVLIEGDTPIDFVDLTVFVAPVLTAQPSMLRRVLREVGEARAAAIEDVMRHLGGPAAMARIFGPVELLMKASTLPGKPTPPTEHWALAAPYEGVQHAHLIVVNARSDAERNAAASVVAEVARLRQDNDVYGDVFGIRGSKRPVTAVIVDLSNSKDTGLKKAITRVKRATKRRTQ